jgi:nanoRNase/pAp phosphatase (c-di-AMP/oligoRNAs hydrolase)
MHTSQRSTTMPASLDPRADTPSSRLLELIEGHQRLLVVTHDHPDPDAIAAGWALTHLVNASLVVPSLLVARGPVIRAENRRLLALLDPPLDFVDQVMPRRGDAVVLVDCSPESSIHMLSGTSKRLLGVIDHHLAKHADSGSDPSRRGSTAESYRVGQADEHGRSSVSEAAGDRLRVPVSRR